MPTTSAQWWWWWWWWCGVCGVGVWGLGGWGGERGGGNRGRQTASAELMPYVGHCRQEGVQGACPSGAEAGGSSGSTGREPAGLQGPAHLSSVPSGHAPEDSKGLRTRRCTAMWCRKEMVSSRSRTCGVVDAGRRSKVSFQGYSQQVRRRIVAPAAPTRTQPGHQRAAPPADAARHP